MYAQELAFANLLQNIDNREKTSLNGLWDIIVDPLENGYYNHRMQSRNNSFFINKKMQSPSYLIEYVLIQVINLWSQVIGIHKWINYIIMKELFGIKKTFIIIEKR